MLPEGEPRQEEEPIIPAATSIVPSYPPRELDEILGDKVLQWRCKQFVDAGFNLHQARKLTCDRTVDLHFVIHHLVGRGCPIDLAFDIAS